MIRLGLSLHPSRHIGVTELVEIVRHAEDLGYHSIWIPETWGADAGTILAILACQTERIHLASGIFNTYSRSAALIAQTAATLQEISRGRFLLGLGASGPKVVEQWHGVPYGRPLLRTREYVAVIRLALSGRQVDYQGVNFQLSDFKLRNPPETPVPIYLAAMGPNNIRLAGEIADGWLPIFAARGALSELFPELEGGATAAGRSVSDLDVAAYLPTALGPAGERTLCQQIAYYVGGMGAFYAEFMARIGFEREVQVIRSLWAAGDRTGAVRAVGREILESCTIGGQAAVARQSLLEYTQEGVSLPILAFPAAARGGDIGADLEALAPVLDGRAWAESEEEPL